MSTVTTADLLVEIGSEELPPRSLRELGEAFAAGIRTGLAEAGLGHGELAWFATPRRLAVLVRAVPAAQPPQLVEKRGPPVAVAFDAAGAPTRAAVAFAEGLGVAVDALERLTTPKGSWLHYRATQPGRPSAALVPEIVVAALAALPIARRMRWGASDTEFVRPVHWVVLLHGADVIDARVLGLAADRVTRGHRFHAPGPHRLATAGDYARVLRDDGHVIADFAARRERVREVVTAAGVALGGTAIIDADLLDEVTSLVEWPAPVTGRLPAEFLRLPEEVLIATLQGHQRYFPVRDGQGRLLPAFVTVSNIESRAPALVAAGNERVVRPRLTDAAFFFDQDRRTPLAARVPDLARVVFQQGLGSLHDKSARVAALGAELAAALGVDADTVARAAVLAKADLLTQMVGEFPELQGTMGGHYARADGEPDAVATAVGEQYLPRHAGDAIPASPAGRALALADRLDSLAGAFAIGKRPSGNKDPFALRRGALGFLRIAIEGGLELDLPFLIDRALALQPKRVTDAAGLGAELYDFVTDRLRSWYLDGLAPGLPAGTVTAEMFEAVRLRRPASPLDFHARLLGVQAFLGLPESQSLAMANKRIANILRTAPVAADAAVDPARFESPAEGALAAAVDAVAARHTAGLARRDYPGVLRALATLREPVDGFFDSVLVMADDPELRRNRLALLARLRQMFLDVADLSCLPAP
jgi:glycyl-tRNA synthetase beta chain